MAYGLKACSCHPLMVQLIKQLSILRKEAIYTTKLSYNSNNRHRLMMVQPMKKLSTGGATDKV